MIENFRRSHIDCNSIEYCLLCMMHTNYFVIVFLYSSAPRDYVCCEKMFFLKEKSKTFISSSIKSDTIIFVLSFYWDSH